MTVCQNVAGTLFRKVSQQLLAGGSSQARLRQARVRVFQMAGQGL